MRRNLIGAIMAKRRLGRAHRHGRSPGRDRRRRAIALPQAEDVDRAGAGAEIAEAVAHGARRRRAGARGRPARDRRRARDGPRASRSACSRSRARRRPGGARPAIVDERLAVEEQVGGLVAVAAGDDDRRGPSAWTRARQRLASRLARPVAREGARPREVRASPRSRAAAMRSTSAARASSGEQPRAGLGDHHRVDDDGVPRRQEVERLGDGLDRSRRRRASRSSRRRRRCPRRRRGPARRSSRATPGSTRVDRDACSAR